MIEVLLVFVLLSSAVLTLYRPFVLFLFFVAVVPMRHLQRISGYPDLQYILGFFVLVATIKEIVQHREYRLTVLDLPIIGLVLAHSLAMYFSTADTTSARLYVSILGGLATYFLTTQQVRSERRYRAVVTTLLLVGVFYSLIASYVLATGELPFFVPTENVERVVGAREFGRFYGPMGTPNNWALLFMFLVPVTLARGITSIRRRIQAFYLVLASIFAFMLLISLSRSAMLGLAGIVVLFLLFSTYTGVVRKQTLSIGTFAGSFFFLSLAYLTGFLQGLLRRVFGFNTTLGGRLERFPKAIEMGITHPFGVGHGQAVLDALAAYGDVPVNKIHNVVLGLFAQTGYLGLVSILAVVLVQARTNAGLLVERHLPFDQRMVVLGTGAGIFGYWVFSMFNYMYDWGFVWLYFGLNITYVGIVRDGSSESPGKES